MPKYVDGYVLPILRKNLPAYRRLARLGSRVWREHGAVAYRECVGDDLASAFGKTFPQQLKLKRGETVVFSWIEFKSRAHRDRVNAKAMADPRFTAVAAAQPMPFDVRRMLYGGFAVLVEG